MALREEVKLFSHQIKGVDFMLRHNYVMNSDEMGNGKTLQAIAVQQASELDCLVICPASLKYNWKEEFLKFTTEKDIKVGIKKAKINIVNYENLHKIEHLFKEARIVIFDEAHYIVNMEAKRTMFSHRYIEKYRPERLILLTGTPMKERVTRMFSLLRLLSLTPHKNNGRSILEKFPTQLKFNLQFSNKHTFKIDVKGRGGRTFKKEITKWNGVKNVDKLKVFMKHKYIRRLAKNVIDLPKVIFNDVMVGVSHQDELLESYNNKQEGKKFDVSVKAQAARDIAPKTADYIKDLIGAEQLPIVVFSDYLEPLDIIENKLKKYKIAKITGDIKVNIRQDVVNRFQGGEIDVLLCTYGAASTGLTLTASWNMVLNDLTWEEVVMSQALKRIDRIGQVKKPIIHRMLGSEASKKIIKMLDIKSRDIEKVIGD